MKDKMRSFIFKCASLLASLAMITAISSAGSTCVMLTYQPELPEELR